MVVRTPPQALAALAGLVRDRLSEVSNASDALRHTTATASPGGFPAVAPRRCDIAVAGAAAPFAASSYARVRLLRQLHATGLLSAVEADPTFALAARPPAYTVLA